MAKQDTKRPETVEEMTRHFMIRDLLTVLFDTECPVQPFTCCIFIGPDQVVFGLGADLVVHPVITVETCRVDLVAPEEVFDKDAFRKYCDEIKEIARVAMIGR